MPGTYEHICRELAEKEYKITPQRKVILQTLLSNPAEHLSAEEIYGLVKSKDPEIGLATVYRTLDLLSDIGILHKMQFGDGRSRYEIAQHREHQHHHLICYSCNSVIEFTDDLLETLEKTISEETGFQIMDHELKIYGHCKKCQQ